MNSRLDRALERLPRAYPGPGGAVAVLREGEVVARGAWGWANAEQRIPFTPKSLFRVCSNTKQFTCALLLDAFPDPAALDGDVRARLPRLEQPAPSALRLCHNQSGLRDYWALGMLHGAPAERPFGEAEAAEVIGRTRTLQFTPGTRYSYCNQNFRLLGDILQDRAGRDFAELLRTRIFDRVGMETAMLGADTRSLPDATEGYEGSQEAGFWPAVNRIVWTGDAGMAASLDDMIAWERHIDATRDDPSALYSRLAVPVSFEDGRPATYGFGLGRATALGRKLTGHGGGLRGWRSHRLYAPAERVSVVVLFNHLAAAHAAAMEIFAAALDEDPPPPRPPLADPPTWLGAYLELETGLSTRIERLADGIRLRFGYPPQDLAARPDGAGDDAEVRLRATGDGVWMDRPSENLSTRLSPLAASTQAAIAGRYRCEELGADLTIVGEGGLFYGACSGFLGEGRMEQLEPVGADVWVLPCPRALDYTAPGDWTLAFRRDAGGAAASVTVGCWLARGVTYARVA